MIEFTKRELLYGSLAFAAVPPVATSWGYEKITDENKHVKIEDFEVTCLVDQEYPNDFEQWPETQRANIGMAVQRQLVQMPEGTKIIKRKTMTGWRLDLSGVPFQLYYSIRVESPA